MKKLFLLLILLFVSISFFGCSNSNVGDDDYNSSVDGAFINENLDNNYDSGQIIVKALTTINIRSGCSTDSEEVGFIRKGDIVEVYEQYDDGEYVWNRIGNNYWIANDGTLLERINGDVDLINENIEFINVRKFPSSIDTYYIHSDCTYKFETYFDKDQNGNIVGYNEIWYAGTDYSSEHPGDNYRFGTIEHLCYGSTTTHEYDNNGNVIKEDLLTSVGTHCVKVFEYKDNKLVKELNYQSSYPSDESLLITEFKYNDNGQLSSCTHSFGNENNVTEIGYYEYNNNLVFYYCGYVGNLENYSYDDCYLYNVYRFDDDGVILENYDENGDHCHIDFIYNYDTFNEISEEFDILITAKAIKTRTTHEISNNNVNGLVNMGEVYTVSKTYRDNDYIWYEIGDNKWIANNGTWCVMFGKDNSNTYPYVVSEDEKEEFLKLLDTGGHTATSSFEDDTIYCNFFYDTTYSKANVIFSIYSLGLESYKYVVSHVVRSVDYIYYVYLLPVNNNGTEEKSLGCIRIDNYGIYYNSGQESEHLYYDLTMIKNNNNKPSNDYFNKLYDLKLSFFVSGQIAY